MSVSSSPRVRVLLVLAAVMNMSVCFVTCASIQRAELDQEILFKELQDLQNVVDQAIFPDQAYEDSGSRSSEEHLSNMDLLNAVLKSAINSEAQDFTGNRKLMPLPGGREIMKRFGFKRGFDSISQNSGFGMHRGSFGGNSGNGENLTFTFESLFPAIARGLRSAKK
ncbi:hypothetical protein ACOMHN_042384 [Nucella lapillus]